MNFFRTPSLLPWLYPQLTWRVKTDDKQLFLTFDDGPVPGPTEFVLDTLRARGITATFFCIGDNVRKHADLFRQVCRDGHVVANHTFNHLSGWKTAVADYVENTRLCSDIMQMASPHESRNLFRPPYGRITRRQIRSLDGYKIIMWDVLTHDYASHSPESCLRGSLNAARPGSIIVFHDSYKAQKNMQFVLPRLIDHFSEQGYSFKSLS